MKVRKAYKITGVSQGNVYTTECIYATLLLYEKLSLLNNSMATKKHKIELLMYNGYEDVNECLGD